MANLNKMRNIGDALRRGFDEIIADLYLNKKLSGQEISDELFTKTKIFITPRSIQRRLKALKIIRPLSEAFNLAIKKGRKSYAHLRKPIKSSELRKGVQLKLRYQILRRDNFKCALCGKTAIQDTILVIDHIKPVVRGGGNDPKNLRTLCRECNHGKMLLEERYE